MATLDEHESVQAPRYTEGTAHSVTEIARIIAKHSEWSLHEDQLFDADRERIAAHITAASRAMEALGWIGGDDNWR